MMAEVGSAETVPATTAADAVGEENEPNASAQATDLIEVLIGPGPGPVVVVGADVR